MPTLTEAFAAVEATQAALTNADNAQSTANDKLTAAQAAKTQADTDDTNAVVAYNSAIDAAVTALQAAKRPGAPPVVILPPTS